MAIGIFLNAYLLILNVLALALAYLVFILINIYV